jgi:hypothetical protein
MNLGPYNIRLLYLWFVAYHAKICKSKLWNDWMFQCGPKTVYLPDKIIDFLDKYGKGLI